MFCDETFYIIIRNLIVIRTSKLLTVLWLSQTIILSMFLTLTILSSALTGTMNENGVLTIEGSEDVTSNLFEEAVKSIQEFQKEKVIKIIFKGSKNINSLPDFDYYPLLKTI